VVFLKKCAAKRAPRKATKRQIDQSSTFSSGLCIS
jgi:hypothetical protein